MTNALNTADSKEEEACALLEARCSPKKGIIKVSEDDPWLYDFLKEYHSVIAKRYIGIFFFINGRLRVYKEPLHIDEGKDFVDIEKGHFELFVSLGGSSEDEDSMYPRGRVLYNVKKRMFYLYADKRILKDPESMQLLKEAYNLPKYNLRTRWDPHYVTLPY